MMNILAIGNSFSEDATRYLHGIAAAGGDEVTVCNLCIGGCSLARHDQNRQSGEAAYVYMLNGARIGRMASLQETLRECAWDVVTLQQASHLSFHYDTYMPYLSNLAAFVRQNAPTARIMIHQTWAYEEGSERLFTVAGYERAADMLRDVVACYQRAADEIRADGTIPSGEMFAALLDAGLARVHRDTYHASLGAGQLALGLLWYRVLCGRSVVGNAFDATDEAVDNPTRALVERTVESFAPLSF